MNKLEWNLKKIFSNNQLFYEEIENIKILVKEINQYKNSELTADLLLTILDKKWKIKELSNNVLIYGSLMYYKNINNNNCIELKRTAEKFNNEVDTALKFIDRKILSLGFKKVCNFIKENPKLNIYKLSLHNLFRLEKHIQSGKTNQKVKENNNNINEQINLYDKLLGNLEYESIIIDGKEVKITPSNFAKYISSRDRKIRQNTYLVINKALQNEKDNFSNLLNAIYGYRIENSILEKYNSVLEKVLFEENINPKIIQKLIKSVNNNLPLIQKYLQIKAKLLEIKEPHLYDLNVPLDSNLKINYSLEEAKKIIFNALQPLGKKYLKIVEILFDGHIDAELDENKHQSITFSWNTYSFMNFRGSYVDLKNMIHEIGHIVNYYLSQENQPFIYEDSTIFVGETASIVNEILLNKYLYKNAKTKEEKLFYLSKEIENYFTSVFKQTMYTEFENTLYKTKYKSNLTADIISEKYRNIIKKYYGSHIIYDKTANIEWTRLGHLYRWSYYPYKYATGLLIANVVVDCLLNKHTLSQEDYLNFLSAGSSQYSLELLKILKIDLLNTNIIEDGFNILLEDIKELDKIISENTSKK